MTILSPPSSAGAAEAAARFAATAPADVDYAVVDTPVGRLVAARTQHGLARLAYEDFNGGLDAVLEALADRLSPRILERPARLDDVRRQLDEYFSGRRTDFDLPIDLAAVRGDFGRRILQACRTIPFGAVSTYRDMATRAGSARAVRAAGNALSANPIPIVVPCHRVVRTGGGLGGYTGGVQRKEQLLRLEGRLV
ncbi:MAG: methylated-DNA-[protein]-cysteine S-methyltransferase [Solirubrobacteraceae bacterium]|nr:methylated-DNA-[protein]-cysteine S-methyltransferase [Solirubrobacteraceae bacterium]